MIQRAEIESILSRFEERVAPAEKAAGETWRQLATAGTEEAQEDLVRAVIAYNEAFANRDEFERVECWY